MELRRRAFKRWVPCGDMDRRLKISHAAKGECGFRTTLEEYLYMYDSGLAFSIGHHNTIQYNTIQYNSILYLQCVRTTEYPDDVFSGVAEIIPVIISLGLSVNIVLIYVYLLLSLLSNIITCIIVLCIHVFLTLLKPMIMLTTEHCLENYSTDQFIY